MLDWTEIIDLDKLFEDFESFCNKDELYHKLKELHPAEDEVYYEDCEELLVRLNDNDEEDLAFHKSEKDGYYNLFVFTDINTDMFSEYCTDKDTDYSFYEDVPLELIKTYLSGYTNVKCKFSFDFIVDPAMKGFSLFKLIVMPWIFVVVGIIVLVLGYYGYL